MFLASYFRVCSWTLKVEAIFWTETSVKFYQNAQRHVLEYMTLPRPYSVQHKEINGERCSLDVGFPFEASDIQNISEIIVRLLSFLSVHSSLILSFPLAD
jgi:hypothetical protein